MNITSKQARRYFWVLLGFFLIVVFVANAQWHEIGPPDGGEVRYTVWQLIFNFLVISSVVGSFLLIHLFGLVGWWGKCKRNWYWVLFFGLIGFSMTWNIDFLLNNSQLQYGPIADLEFWLYGGPLLSFYWGRFLIWGFLLFILIYLITWKKLLGIVALLGLGWNFVIPIAVPPYAFLSHSYNYLYAKKHITAPYDECQGKIHINVKYGSFNGGLTNPVDSNLHVFVNEDSALRVRYLGIGDDPYFKRSTSNRVGKFCIDGDQDVLFRVVEKWHSINETLEVDAGPNKPHCKLAIQTKDQTVEFTCQTQEVTVY